MCIELGPVRDDSVRRGGGGPPLPGSNPPCAGSRRHGLLPGLLVIACYLSFTPSSLKLNMFDTKTFRTYRNNLTLFDCRLIYISRTKTASKTSGI